MKKFSKSLTLFAIGLYLLGTLATGCKKDNDIKVSAEKFDARAANAWMSLSVELTKTTPGFSPPVAARAYAYCGVALYQAVIPGSDEYVSLEGQINGLTEGAMPDAEKGKEYHWGYVANMALKTTFAHFYRNAHADQLAKIDSLAEVFYDEARNEASEEVLERSKTFGEAVGRAVIEYSKSDWQDE